MSTSLIPKPKIKIPSSLALESFQREMRDRRVTIDPGTRQAIDSFQNALARIGWGTSNLSEGAAYPMTRLSRNFILLTSLYRSHWIARRVIDCIAEDIMKNWINIVSDVTPEKLKQFNRSVTSTNTKAKLLEAIKMARLYGGAGAVILIKGQGDQLDEPLDLDSIGPDSYRGLLVLDRWSGISPSGNVSTDLDDPVQFGLPETYMVTTDTKTFTVHHSRVLRFTGRSLPWWEWLAEMRWGISEYELIFDELKKRDNTSWNLASLIFRANIFSIKFKDLAANLSGLGKSAQAQQQFYNILSAQNQLMSNQGILVLPEDGGIETHQYAFSGINEVYESFMLDICGASEIPMSRLFGRTYSGLGQTNIGDEHTYYDIVGQKQQRELDPQLQKLLPIIALSTWGKIPKEFEWFFKPVRSLSNEEQADLATKLSAPVFAAVQSNLISRKEARKELKQISDTTNVFSNLNDDVTEAMPDDLGPEPGEVAEAQLDNLLAEPEEAGEKSERKAGKGERPEKKPAPAASKKSAKKAKGQDAAVDEGTFMRAWDHALEGRAEFQGLKISIENDIGSTRSGVGPDGQRWQTLITWPYGRITSGTEGVDGDAVDVFLGPNPDAEFVYVVHTKKRLPDGTFEGYDEDKCMCGWDSEAEAKQAFLENYDDPQHFGSIETLPVAKFRERVLETHVGKKIPGSKSTQKTANYQAIAANAKQSCQYCEHFVPGSVPDCRVVKFSAQKPVSPTGWCRFFDNKHTVDAAPPPEKFKGSTIEEQVADLMEHRSFGYEAEGDDWVDYSRGDYRNGSHSNEQWKNVPLTARGRWCRVYFGDGKVDRCECYSSEGLNAEKDVRKGWDGLFSFTQAYGD